MVKSVLIGSFASFSLVFAIFTSQLIIMKKGKESYIMIPYVILTFLILIIGSNIVDVDKCYFDILLYGIVLIVPALLFIQSFLIQVIISKNSSSKKKEITTLFKLVFSEYISIVYIPTLEEYFYRGILFEILGSSCGIGITIVVSSALFSISHLRFVACIESFFGGIVLAAVYEYTKSLILVIFIHSIYNMLCRFIKRNNISEKGE